MAWTLHIDPAVNCSFIKHYGPFDLSALDESTEARLNHPDFKVGMNFLHDFLDQRIPPDLAFKTLSEESNRLVKKYGYKVGPCKGALVVGDGQSYAKIHQFVLTNRFEKNPIERKAFRDIEKAKEWLDIPEGYEINYPGSEETT